jgi:hypothetical protein
MQSLLPFSRQSQEAISYLLHPRAEGIDLRRHHAALIGQEGEIEPRPPEPNPDSIMHFSAYFDSSDSELEERMRKDNNITDQNSYVDYLHKILFSDDVLSNPAKLKSSIGLLLHNYSDRIFNSGQMKSVYTKMKSEMLPISEEEYFNAASKIEAFLIDHGGKYIDGLDTIYAKKDKYQKSEDLIKICNYMFNKDISLPDGLSEKALASVSSSSSIRELVTASFKDNKIELLTKKKSSNSKVKGGIELELSAATEDDLVNTSQILLTFSQILGRRDRRETKKAAIAGIGKDTWESSIHAAIADEYEEESYAALASSAAAASKSISKEPENSEALHHLGGNSMMGRVMVKGLSSYFKIGKTIKAKSRNEASESDGITKEECTKKFMCKLREFVQTGVTDNNFVKSLGHLMFVTETQRTRAAALTSAMFLDEAERTGKIDFKKYPMEMKGAVDAIRDMHKEYADKLPATRKYDEGTAKASLSGTLLRKETDLFLSFLTSRKENGFVISMDISELSQELKGINRRNPTTPSPDFAILRHRISSTLSLEEKIPVEFDEFKNWIVEKSIPNALLEKSRMIINTCIKNSLEIIDKEIWQGFYKIGNNKTFGIRAKRGRKDTIYPDSSISGDSSPEAKQPKLVSNARSVSSSMRSSLESSQSERDSSHSRTPSPIANRTRSKTSERRNSF